MRLSSTNVPLPTLHAPQEYYERFDADKARYQDELRAYTAAGGKVCC